MLNEREDGVKRCPRCFGRDVRPSLRRGAVDKIMKMLGRAPYRCRGCHNRFYVFIPRAKDDLDEEAEITVEPLDSNVDESEESKTEEAAKDAPKPAAP